MDPKPAGLGPKWAAQFQDPSVIAAYGHRPAYPPETFRILAGLAPRLAERRVLDIGCGTGDLARHLPQIAAAVDALDVSAGMLAVARSLLGGDEPRLRWIQGPAEQAPLDPPYALVTASESIHWMDWSLVIPRIAGALADDGWLVIVNREELDQPWIDAMRALIPQFSTNDEFTPYEVIEELSIRGLFELAGVERTDVVRVRMSVDHHVEAIHSRNGFSRDRMTADAAATFDRAYRALLMPHADEEQQLTFGVRARIAWGRPTSPPAS